MIGQRVQHYQITEKLGEGGMGVVYRAQDTRLNRSVALKFLHPAIVASADDQQRLVHEARAAAALSHPNICTVYEINEHDGRTFIAMQFVEGTTLRDRVLSGRIETVDALRYLIQIADGLKQAHEQGIVHRDMKSSNIMITPSGRAVIMDFGLARPAGTGRGDERFSSRGTSAYMSPEQARGELVDQRTDIWSLGVVLYEMLAGRLPFRGDYEQAVVYSILNEPHRPITEFRAGLPPAVIKVVETCLVKNPADRYQSLDALIHAVRAALDDMTGRRRGGERWGRARVAGAAAAAVLTVAAGFVVYDFLRGGRAGGEARVPIAVIDFNNETDQAALDGLSGMLITALEQSRRLSVMTRSRMFDIAKTIGHGDAARIDEALGQRICEAAGVDALVIPTIRRFGDLYSIDLKVMDTRRHNYIFTTKEEGRGLESIPNMVDAIARDIRIDLRETTESVARTAPLADVTTTHLGAYQAYFEGEELLDRLQFGPAGKAFERAIARDSTFALAYYRLAYTEWWSRQNAKQAKQHIDYAIANLDHIPQKERYLVRALKVALDDGFEAQLPVLKEMRTLYPDDKEMLFGLGDAEFHSNQFDSAEVHFRAALAIDPEMERALQHLTWTLMRLDRYQESFTIAERWARATESSEAYEYLAITNMRLGRPDEAMRVLETARKREPRNQKLLVRESLVLYATHRPQDALAKLDEAERIETQDMLSKLEVGQMRAMVLYPYLGRYRDAARLMEQAREMSVSTFSDSTGVVNLAVGESVLGYWAHQDARRTIADLNRLSSVRKKFLSDDYYRSLAFFHMIVGDSARSRELLASHSKYLSAPERLAMRIFEVAASGDCASADEMLRAALDAKEFLGSSEDGLHYIIGRCRLEAGAYDAAIASLRSIVDREVYFADSAAMIPVAWFYLGESYERKGDVARAASAYERVLELWKNGDSDLYCRKEARIRLDRLAGMRSM
ncbi:MAG: protein kinase [Candidatus Latescibacteria bacterium]|nr:protein kinase [Candidatus Latescibacterota bacterium]